MTPENKVRRFAGGAPYYNSPADLWGKFKYDPKIKDLDEEQLAFANYCFIVGATLQMMDMDHAHPDSEALKEAQRRREDAEDAAAAMLK